MKKIFNWCFDFICHKEIQRTIDEIELRKKYKVVIKENWLGFRSVEYHEK